MKRGHQRMRLVAPLLFVGGVAGCGFGDDGDRFPPIVTITSPNTQIVRGLVTFSADVADDTGVSLVRFFVDDTMIFEDTHAPFTTEWDSTTVPDGPHLLRVRAFDPTGNGGSIGKNVTVSNLPPNAP